MSRFKKIIAINSLQDIEEMLNNISDIPSEVIKSYECILDVGENGKIDLYNKNNKIDINSSFFFIRMKSSTYGNIQKEDHNFLSILSRLLHMRDIPHNSPVYRYHSDSSEKTTQMVVFSESNIPHPHSIICHYESYLKNKETILSKTVFPCVLKQSGMCGESVWKVNSKKDLEKRLKINNKLSIIQEYIPNTYDIRVLIFDGEYIGAQKKTSIDGFYNHVSRGAIPEVTDITEEEKQICIRAARVSENMLSGIDLVRSDRGPLIFEANRYPCIVDFEKDTGLPVRIDIAKMIKNKFFR